MQSHLTLDWHYPLAYPSHFVSNHLNKYCIQLPFESNPHSYPRYPHPTSTSSVTSTSHIAQPSAPNRSFNSMQSFSEQPNPIPVYRQKRLRISDAQLRLLHAAYSENRFPPLPMRQYLAEQTGMTCRAVQIWFQNKRQTERRLSGANLVGKSGSTFIGTLQPHTVSSTSIASHTSLAVSTDSAPTGSTSASSMTGTSLASPFSSSTLIQPTFYQASGIYENAANYNNSNSTNYHQHYHSPTKEVADFNSAMGSFRTSDPFGSRAAVAPQIGYSFGYHAHSPSRGEVTAQLDSWQRLLPGDDNFEHTRPSIHDKMVESSMYHAHPDQDTHAGQSASTLASGSFSHHHRTPSQAAISSPIALRPSVALQQRPPFRLPVPAALKTYQHVSDLHSQANLSPHIQSASISKSFPSDSGSHLMRWPSSSAMLTSPILPPLRSNSEASGALDGLHHYPSMNTLKISPHSPPSFDRPSLSSQSMTCRYADNTINAALPALAASAEPDSMPLSNSYTPPLSATIISTPPYQVISSVKPELAPPSLMDQSPLPTSTSTILNTPVSPATFDRPLPLDYTTTLPRCTSNNLSYSVEEVAIQALMGLKHSSRKGSVSNL
ncbi:hypothetical protein O5D80_007342 [Batrachochytrium dendrobatidis]|nr:hypothetical protein O5D80_007342 [Batrachochytrium dendrobatidis]